MTQERSKKIVCRLLVFAKAPIPGQVNLSVAENNYPIGHPHPTLPPLRGRARVGGGLHLK